MLDKVLNAAIRGGLRNILGGRGQAAGRGPVGGLGSARGGPLGGMLGGVMGQTAITAALGMLMRRGGAGRLMKVGGLASLGMMAYQAWQQYQQRAGATGGQHGATSTGPNRASLLSPEAFAPAAGNDEPDEAEAEALLAAMIEAAKADGHVDDEERARIEQAMKADDDADDARVAAWLAEELKRPVDAGAVARLAGGNEALASKIYLASVIVAGGDGSGTVTAEERQYLDALARALRWPESLQSALEGQAKGLG